MARILPIITQHENEFDIEFRVERERAAMRAGTTKGQDWIDNHTDLTSALWVRGVAVLGKQEASRIASKAWDAGLQVDWVGFKKFFMPTPKEIRAAMVAR